MFRLIFSLVILSIPSAIPSRSNAQDCAYLPPGGPLAFGLLEVSRMQVDSQVADSPIWLDDGRIAVGAALSSQDGYRRGAIWIMKPYASSLHDIQSFILPPLPAIKLGTGGFGRVLASSGSWLAATARLTNDSFTVCLLQATNATEWAFRTNLLGDPNASGDAFGSQQDSIAMDGPWLAVIRYESSGRVHLYRVNDEGLWEERQQLVIPGFQTAAINSSTIVKMHDRTLAVGVPQNGNSSYTGAAHLWRRDVAGVWNYETNLAPADLAAADRFGTSLALGPDKVFVGATQSDIVTTNAGAAFVFHYTNGAWAEVTRIAPTNATTTRFFGANLAYSDLKGEWLVDASQSRISMFQPSGQGHEWRMVAQGRPGRIFENWESPAGVVNDYSYDSGSASANYVSVRAHQVLLGFSSISTIMEFGWHSIITIHVSSDPPCSTRPIGYVPIGAVRDDGHERAADVDGDGISDIAEIYFGTYGLTNTVSAGLSATVSDNVRKIRWPRAADTNLLISATPQWSSNFLQWTQEGITPIKVGTEPETGRDVMEVTLPDSSSAYFRLLLSLPPPQ
ncbi:MAG TPA: hypothetical protein VEH04_16595 [Verrucomicrobiae bacterium]|nr:hypothetical protein [Verrucomicrobiae bacterium]